MATGTTKRVASDEPVPWKAAVSAWAAAGRPVLERVARSYDAYLTYQQLAEEVQEKTISYSNFPELRERVALASPMRSLTATQLTAPVLSRRFGTAEAHWAQTRSYLDAGVASHDKSEP